MKPLLLGIALWMTISWMARAEDQITKIKQEAEKYAKAFVTGDYENLVLYLHPRVIKAFRGKEAAVARLKTTLSQLEAKTGPVDLIVGQPEAPKKIGLWVTSVVPAHLVVRAPGRGKRSYDSDFVGISENDGKSWFFVDLAMINTDSGKRLFPELAGEIEPRHLNPLRENGLTNAEPGAAPKPASPNR